MTQVTLGLIEAQEMRFAVGGIAGELMNIGDLVREEFENKPHHRKEREAGMALSERALYAGEWLHDIARFPWPTEAVTIMQKLSAWWNLPGESKSSMHQAVLDSVVMDLAQRTYGESAADQINMFLASIPIGGENYSPQRLAATYTDWLRSTYKGRTKPLADASVPDRRNW